ncbi:MAG: hypothetical protein GXO70_09900 [Acidobacteria bacterium]|nr:hypothetical protein [Acidobacteriota bacterium]
MKSDNLPKQRQKGGATLITTLVVLLLLTVLGMGLLRMSTDNIQSAGGYQSSEQAFNVAEAGLELVGRNYITNYYAAINYLFANRSDITQLPDPNFGDLDALISNTGVNGAYYATYYSQFPQFTGEVQIDEEIGLSGTYYVRIIDNDVLTLEDGNYYNRYEDEDGDYYNNVIQPNFTIDRDHNLLIQSRSIIRKGNTIIATKLVTARFCSIPEASGSQVSQSAANVNLTPAFCKQPWLVKQ